MDCDALSGKTTAAGLSNADLIAAIDAGLLVMKEKLASNGADKTLLTDLVKLLQLRKELAEDVPRQIKVRWVERDECLTSND